MNTFFKFYLFAITFYTIFAYITSTFKIKRL